MQFAADFHIHSKYSRATAANLDLEHLYIAAQVKGLSVIGTGDFTHPAWWQDIRSKLEPAEQGLFKLKSDLARDCDALVPRSCRRSVRFILVTEISNIYKKQHRTRKNHNLVFLPDYASVDKFNRRLDKIGNIHSDGRPILGLDARNLLEIVLETHDRGFLVPAHIWTPWFSLLGSKSGFDAVEACFGDLTNHIFALETGLSSDPPMNRRVSALDRYTLISNSDAHSPSKLGREATLFDTDLNYSAIYEAMRSADPYQFLGTLEFYPEEGKYHVDGHRKCGFHCHPEETRRLEGCCPVCGKALTLGVLYRVDALADRDQDRIPDDAIPFQSLIPLTDLLSEVLQVGPTSKKVQQTYDQIVHSIGPELDILRDAPLDRIESCGIPLLGESLRRMRTHDLHFEPGFDGQFGKVRLFKPGERQKLLGQQSLFTIPANIRIPKGQTKQLSTALPAGPKDTGQLIQPPSDEATGRNSGTIIRLNEDQQKAVGFGPGHLIINAGPGTGKTRTITCRMAALLERGEARPERMLAVTFTRHAAEEMRRRIQRRLNPYLSLPTIATFHGFCLRLLKEVYEEQAGSVLDERGRRVMIEDAIAQAATRGSVISIPPERILNCIVQAKQMLLLPDDDLTPVVNKQQIRQLACVYNSYQHLLKIQNLYDYEDLVCLAIELLEKDSANNQRFTHIFIDEFQDINYAQYRLLRALAGKDASVCAIGDPNQAIYGFRGSDSRYFEQFRRDFCGHRSLLLKRNYRSSETILTASFQLITKAGQPQHAAHARIKSGIDGYPAIVIMQTGSERAEATCIGRTIEQMVGGTSFQSVDFGKLDTRSTANDCSFSDFAILCRTGQQARFIADNLTRANLPCQLVSTQVRQEAAVSKLIACFRVVNGKGTYADLNLLTGLIARGTGKETLSMFKQWAYAKQLPLDTALQVVNRIPIAGLSQGRQHRLAALCRFLNMLSRQTEGMDTADALKYIAANTTLSTRLGADQLEHLVHKALAYGRKTEQFADHLALEQDSDVYQSGVEKVAVMTMHASKGLEFPVLFIAGCEAGLIPYDHPGPKTTDIEEERRLFYVAMTRAKDRVYCTWARRRTIYGKTRQRQLSPFLQTIAGELKQHENTVKSASAARQQQLSLF